MKPTDQTLLEQLRITEPDLQQRKALFGIRDDDLRTLRAALPRIEDRLEALVARFHDAQTAVPDIALLIGDAETSVRLRDAQHRYVLSLFSGVCDLDYVGHRLRIGQAHKRIGVTPKLYLAALHGLQHELIELLREALPDTPGFEAARCALGKLMAFDSSLVFETYIRSLVADVETALERSEQYARTLAGQLRERSRPLDALDRSDALTGLLGAHHLGALLGDALRAAQRRAEPLTLAHVSIDSLHAAGEAQSQAHEDEVLRAVAGAIRRISRDSDYCFRSGSDEFCIVLQNCREAQASALYLARLRDQLDLLREPVSVRVGFVETGLPDYLSPEALLRDARQAAATVIHAPRGAGPGELTVKPA